MFHLMSLLHAEPKQEKVNKELFLPALTHTTSFVGLNQCMYFGSVIFNIFNKTS